LFLFIGFLLITSCIYDPPEGVLYIKNNSDSSIYVYVSCDDSIHQLPSLTPQNRINGRSEGGIVGFGYRNKPKMRCVSKKLRLYFITQKTIEEKSWVEIVEKQLFIRKMILTQEELDKNNWHLNY